MTTVDQLKHDLEALLAECKRKHADVRTATETALNAAKKVDPKSRINDNVQLQHTLCVPFMMAVAGGLKPQTQALSVLPKLIAASALPADFADDLLQSFYKNDVHLLPLDSQLKILQTIPALMQNYEIHGKSFLLLVAVLCLLMGSGSPALSNTASATMQQVFSGLYDKLGKHTKGDQLQAVELASAGSEKPHVFHLDSLESECYKVFNDLSALVANDEVEYFDPDIHIRRVVVLEIIENVLSLNKATFRDHEELIALCRVKTFPALLKLVTSTTHNFPTIVRALRIIHLLVATQADLLGMETEIVLSSTNHLLLDAEDSSSRSLSVTAVSAENVQPTTSLPFWVKVLVLEMYKTLFNNFDVVRVIYETYDRDEKKKNVIRELFSVLNHYLESSLPQFFAEETIPNAEKNTSRLSKQNAALKVSLLDHLDKTDPPASVPPLYPAHLVFKILISVADGVSEFVSRISANSNTNDIEANVDFITSFNETISPEVFKLLKKYLHCATDNEYFHNVVRAVQRYTHAVGLLGMTLLRDDLLVLLSDCVIKGPAPLEPRKHNNSNLLALGESIVDTISSTIQAPASPQNSQASQFESSSKKSISDDELLAFGSRVFTSRQIICYRALSNLAISLGLTLQDSWRIMWITFQWVDYFLSGADEYSGFANNKELKKFAEPQVSSQDFTIIRNARAKLLESISAYQPQSFEELVKVLTLLYNEDLATIKTIQTCPFNRSFFIRLLVLLVTNSPSLLLENQPVWDHLINYFTDLATDRSIPHHRRNFYVTCMNDVVVSVTKEGFHNSNDTDGLAAMSLKAFITFIDKLFGLPDSEELLVSNCETEMHLTVLTTLRSLIDEFDDRFQNCWGLVFTILRSVFHKHAGSNVQDKKLDEKTRLLIATSFDTLKLILDEFLNSLPEEHLKTLIDTLVNFCSQEHDLNISFSSVSYFWSISDAIRSHMDGASATSSDISVEEADTIKKLELALEKCSTDTIAFNQGLNVYLLARLSDLSSDSRTQVREGAIQTLFQILDAHGRYLPSWQMMYDVVLPGVIDVSRWKEKSTSPHNDIISTFNLVLSGLVAVLNKYMIDFTDKATLAVKLQFWLQILNYFNNLLALNWKDLNLKIFQSFQDLILPLPKVKDVPSEVVNSVFDFWVNVPVEYDFVNPEYQDSLAVFNRSFTSVYPVVEHRLSLADLSKVLSLLNQCARYPVLKSSLNDSEKLTDIQKAVIENLKLLCKNELKDEFNSVIIQHLCIILCYPYQTRTRIERKLKSKFEGRLKIPTFTAISEASLELMTEKIHGLGNLNVLLPEQGFEKLVSSLIEAVSYKAQGCQGNEKPQWVKCNELITHLAQRLLNENLSEVKNRNEVWHLLVDALTVCFEDVKPEEEKETFRQIDTLEEIVLPVLFLGNIKQEEALQQTIGRIYSHSYLYEMNNVERELCEGSLEHTISSLANFAFNDCFGTTAQLVPYKNRDIRLRCLVDLFNFALNNDRSLAVAFKFALARASFTLRRVIAEQRLLNKKPMARILEEELKVVLDGLKKVQMARKERMGGISILLSKLVPFVSNIEGMGARVERILLRSHAE